MDMDIHGYIHGYYAGTPANYNRLTTYMLFSLSVSLSVVLILYLLVHSCCYVESSHHYV